jgi:hypothetical protein
MSLIYELEYYQINIWYIKDSSCGNFTDFFSRPFAISQYVQEYRANFDKRFQVSSLLPKE